MPAPLTIVRSVMNALGALSPGAGAAVALPLFMRVGRRLPVRDADLATHESARRSTIRVNGRLVAVYEWGHGAETVLLVHGWHGRASQFATLVRELRAEGYMVAAFDAPANGASEGRRTIILDYIDAIGQLQRRYGGFRAIVGHSFGVLAALIAVNEGVRARSVIGVAGVSDADYLVEGFATQLTLLPSTVEALRRRFARRLFPAEPDLFDRFSAVRHPLPAEIPLLLVHDQADAQVPTAQSRRLFAANRGHAELLVTVGLGHTRILGADQTLDAVITFIAADDHSREATISLDGRNAVSTRRERSSSTEDLEKGVIPGPTDYPLREGVSAVLEG